MSTNLPGSADTFTEIPAGARQPDVIGGRSHRTHHNDLGDAVEALTAMVGTGATSSAPARGKTRVGDGTGTARWDTLARKNLLINGGMRLAQRAMPTADNSYCLDRWRLLLGAANAFTVSQETSDVPSGGSPRALRLTAGSGNNNKGGIFQILEYLDVEHLRGKKVSVQATLKATAGIATAKLAIVEFTGTADSVSGDPISSWGSQGTNPTLAANYAYLGTPTAIVPTTSHVVYRLEGVTVGASANNLAVFVWSDDTTTTQTTDYMIVTDLQLEEGEVCTDVERRHVQQELTLCQRYYQKSWAPATAVGTASGNGAIVAGGATDNDNLKSIYGQIRYVVPMRGTPNVTLYDIAGNSGKVTTFVAAGTTTNNVSPTTGVALASSERCVVLHGGTIAGFQFHFTADAEL